MDILTRQRATYAGGRGWIQLRARRCYGFNYELANRFDTLPEPKPSFRGFHLVRVSPITFRQKLLLPNLLK
jgi:hypothetical protein